MVVSYLSQEVYKYAHNVLRDLGGWRHEAAMLHLQKEDKLGTYVIVNIKYQDNGRSLKPPEDRKSNPEVLNVPQI